MKNIAQRLNYNIAGLTTAITLDSYRRLLSSDNIDKKTIERLIENNQQLTETVRRSTEIMDRLEKKQTNNQVIVDKINEIGTSIESMKNKTNDILNNVSLDNNNKVSLNCDNEYIVNNSIEIKNEFINTDKIINDLVKLLSDDTTDSSNNYINLNIFNDVYNYISSLNIIQVSTVSHILVSICVLWCLSNILITFFSDKIIVYFNLENNYPKLGKFIRIRRQFQQYYILINSIFIIVIVMFITYLDILFFIKIS